LEDVKTKYFALVEETSNFSSNKTPATDPSSNEKEKQDSKKDKNDKNDKSDKDDEPSDKKKE